MTKQLNNRAKVCCIYIYSYIRLVYGDFSSKVQKCCCSPAGAPSFPYFFFHSCRQLFSFCSLGEGGEHLPNIFHCIQNLCNSQNNCSFPSATLSLTTWVTDKRYHISHHSCTYIHILLPNQQSSDGLLVKHSTNRDILCNRMSSYSSVSCRCPKILN